MDDTSRVVRHVGPPTALGVALLSLYAVPRDFFGCANRGWIALALIALAIVGTIVTMAMAVRAARADRADRRTPLLWMLSAAIFLLPSFCVALYEVSLARLR